MRRLTSVLLAALLPVGALQVAATGAVRQPVVTAVQAPDAARAGEAFTAKVVVANRGRHRADPVRMKVVLSRDTEKDRNDARVATVDVPALKAGARRVLKVQVRPKRIGERYVVACVRRSCRHAKVVVNGAPGADPAVPPPPGDPLDVTPVLDTAHAVSALVEAETGATITATGADGSVFELVVPPDGLMTDEEITLTPVASLGGLPFAGDASAVDITPNGLQLARVATLTITPPTSIPLDRQFVFSTRGSGKDFHSYPPTLDASAIRLPLLHFSIPGVGSATTAERAAAALKVPADAQAQLEKIIGEQTAQMKRDGHFDGDALVPNLRQYYKDVVRPRLVAATTDDTIAVLAMTSYLAWQRQAGLTVTEVALAEEIAEGAGLMEDVLRFAFDHGFERCMAGETAYAPILLTLARTIAVLGGPESVDDLAQERLLKCARFELDYDARVVQDTQDDKSSGHIRGHDEVTVEAHDVVLHAEVNDAGRIEVKGTQPLVVTEWIHSTTFDSNETAGNAEVVDPLVVEATLPLSSRLETAKDGRTRFVLNRGRPSVVIDPGSLKLYYIKGAPTPQWPALFTYRSTFSQVWDPERLEVRPRFFRFTAFFDETLPKLGLYLEERNHHRDVDQFVTDSFCRLRMELEHAPKP